jgi:hypothetical protein
LKEAASQKEDGANSVLDEENTKIYGKMKKKAWMKMLFEKMN